MKHLELFLLIVIISVIEYVGDSNFKLYARSDNTYNMSIGIIAYLIMIFFLIYVLKNVNVIYVNGIWDGISAIVGTLFAILILHETLSNNIQYLGLVFIIMGIIVLNYGKIPY